MNGTGVPENYVFQLVLIKVDQRDITLSRLCYYVYIYIYPGECKIFSFVPLRCFFSATLAKRWMVQFRQGFAQLNNVDSMNDI